MFLQVYMQLKNIFGNQHLLWVSFLSEGKVYPRLVLV